MDKDKLKGAVASELIIVAMETKGKRPTQLNFEEMVDVVVDVVNKNFILADVSSSTFTIDDMKKAFMAGADKKYWTKIYLTGIVSGQDYVLEPIFEKWFEYYR